MARSVGISVENSFVKGLITEATGLNYPENSCLETYDCVFEKTGEVYRRPAINVEDNFSVYVTSTASLARNEYTWRAVSQNGSLTFVVAQLGRHIYFFRVDDVGSISNHQESFLVDLNTYAITGAPSVDAVQASFTSGNGLLFIAHPYCDPVCVEYDEDAENITVTVIRLKIRDMFGLPSVDGSGNVIPTDQPIAIASITASNIYNLKNQGWYPTNPCTTTNKFWTDTNVLDFYVGIRGFYPAESEVWWLYKAPLIPIIDSTGNLVAGAPREALSFFEVSSHKTSNTPAPKGHYILEAFYQDRETASGLSGISVVSSGYQRPSQIAFYAGRVFYAGVNSTGFSGKIYFTQILDGAKNIDKAYQNQDPTDESSNDLLVSDGGWIEIPELGRVVKLSVVGNALVVTADNGTWSISGSEGIGFTATDHNVSKISSVGAEGPNSFVEVDGAPVWWNMDGVWTLKAATPGAPPSVMSLSDSTIKDFFADIPAISKTYAKGAYNPFTRIVQWIYRSTEESGVANRYVYDRILNLDASSGAFYPWTVPTSPASIAGLCAVQGISLTTTTGAVTVGGTTVTVGGTLVTIDEGVRTSINSVFKYVTTTSTGVTFAEFNNSAYYDWAALTASNLDYTSYFVTAPKLRGEGMRKWQSNYVRLFTKNEVNSQLDFCSRWDYSLSGDTGRWSSVQRIIMDDSNYAYRSKRLKVRGSGLAMSFKVSSVSGQPFNLIGWTSLDSVNNAP